MEKNYVNGKLKAAGVGIAMFLQAIASTGCSDSIDDAVVINGQKVLFEDGNDGWRIPLYVSDGIDYVAEAVFGIGGKPGTFGEGDKLTTYNMNNQACMTIEDNDEDGKINKRDDDKVIYQNGDKQIVYAVDHIVDQYGDTHYPDDEGADILFKHRDAVFVKANKIFPGMKRDFIEKKSNELSDHYKDLLKEMIEFEQTGPCSPNYNP